MFDEIWKEEFMFISEPDLGDEDVTDVNPPEEEESDETPEIPDTEDEEL
jgi:hypothetical protein